MAQARTLTFEIALRSSKSSSATERTGALTLAAEDCLKMTKNHLLSVQIYI